MQNRNHISQYLKSYHCNHSPRELLSNLNNKLALSKKKKKKKTLISDFFNIFSQNYKKNSKKISLKIFFKIFLFFLKNLIIKNTEK